ncbi:MAG: transporter [Anaerohalosphaeraceae bacterium]
MLRTKFSVFVILIVLSMLVPGKTLAATPPPLTTAADAGADDALAAAAQNPVASMYSLPFEFTFDFGADDGDASILNIQPVIPVTMGDWNYISRIIVPLLDLNGNSAGIPSIPNGTTGSGDVSGLGDINYTLFLSPAKAGEVIWGVGPSVSFPTATDDRLGSEKYSAGPSAVFLTQPKPWTLGLLVRNLWSFAGESDRKSVNQFLAQPFVNYNLDKGWYLTSQPVITANWNADSGDRWTIPVGGGVGKIMKIGNQPVNIRLASYWNADKPDGGPDWSIVFAFQLMFPK